MSSEESTKPQLPAHEIREIAVAAEVDPRTVRKFMLGVAVLPLPRRRIERALQARALNVAAGGSR